MTAPVRRPNRVPPEQQTGADMGTGQQRSQGRIIPTGWDEPDARPRAVPSAPSGVRPGAGPGGSGTLGGSRSPGGLGGRRRLIAVGAVLALLAGLAVIVPGVLNRSQGPESVVREYLDALIAGDTDTMLERIPEDSTISTAGITEQIYLGATDRVQSYGDPQVTIDGTTATVTVTLDNGTEQYDSRFTLTGHAPNFYSPLQWRLDPVVLGEVELHMQLSAEKLLVNGVELQADELTRPTVDGQQETVLQLLPGTYEFSLPEQDEVTTPVVTSVTVLPTLGTRTRSTTERMLAYALTEKGEQQVEQQVAERLEECATSQARQPDFCPFAVPVGEREAGQPVGGTWEILEQSPLEIRPGPLGGFDVFGSGGSAQFTPHPGPDGTAQEPITVEIELRGIVLQDSTGGIHTVVAGEDDSIGFVVCLDAETAESYVAAEFGEGGNGVRC